MEWDMDKWAMSLDLPLEQVYVAEDKMSPSPSVLYAQFPPRKVSDRSALPGTAKHCKAEEAESPTPPDALSVLTHTCTQTDASPPSAAEAAEACLEMETRFSFDVLHCFPRANTPHQIYICLDHRPPITPRIDLIQN
ncbi:unnamed protein product [Pleuronectes platessa]|uniref:Uncharacterized protein n=1 Tax=Pleuronectes platessa TaxID=8262 RepID=A0A9N7TJJ0_PLEPL|nr:unnamed protein product [Pleuronectes platessa]